MQVIDKKKCQSSFRVVVSSSYPFTISQGTPKNLSCILRRARFTRPPMFCPQKSPPDNYTSDPPEPSSKFRGTFGEVVKQAVFSPEKICE